MQNWNLTPELQEKVIQAQKAEITEYHIYVRLEKICKDDKTRKVLIDIATHELEHYEFWQKISGQKIEPDWGKVRKYVFLSRIFGMSFSIKLMEKEEIDINIFYKDLEKVIPGTAKIMNDEKLHEQELTDIVGEEKLQYTSSIVLGLNDALVEFTGGLAGWTLALRNTNLIALVAIILGISAALSMAVSEYLSTKSEKTTKHPFQAALYTGIAYICAVFILVLPFIILKNELVSLGLTIIFATIIILIFTFYASVTEHKSFKKKFFEMFILSMSVAGISFFIGFVIRYYLKIEV